MNAAHAPTGAAGLLHRILRHPRLALTVLCLILWVPGTLSLPPLDRDESRFAQASKQMLETGNFIDIRFGAVPRYKKPVGIYWMQAATTEIAGLGDRTHIWTYRLPSLLGALIAVWLAYWCAAPFLGAQTSFLGAGLLGTTLLLSAEADIATTDAVLLACVMGFEGMLLRAYMAVRNNGPAVGWKLAMAGWVALGVGLLVKGPAVLVVPVVSMIFLSLWDRDARWLKTTKPAAGVLVALLITLPWFIAIWIKSHGLFFEQSVGQDFAAKLAGGQESHGQPPGYFLALMNISFWPAILFLLPAAALAVRLRAEPVVRFLIVWALAWIVYEFVPTKLPHYVLPVYPALALLAAMWAVTPPENASRIERVLAWVGVVQFALVSAAFAVAPVLLTRFYGEATQWWLIAPMLVFAALVAVAVLAAARQARLTAAVLTIGAAVVLYPTLMLGAAPRLDRLWVSERAAEAVKPLMRPGDPPPALVGYVEPSLVFGLGTATRLIDARAAAEVGAAQGGLVLVNTPSDTAFRARLAELEADVVQLGTVDGLNYSAGRPAHIRIYRVVPVRDVPAPPAE